MGSGDRRPNTPVLPRRRQTLVPEGGPAIKCPHEGTLTAEWFETMAVGRSGELVADGKRVVLLAKEGPIASAPESESVQLLRCLDADFSYAAELIVGDRGAFIRFQRS